MFDGSDEKITQSLVLFLALDLFSIDYDYIIFSKIYGSV